MFMDFFVSRVTVLLDTIKHISEPSRLDRLFFK